MLKTVSAKERCETYVRQNPREIKAFSREDARKIEPGKVQVKVHGS